ncbi:MAG: dUTP diphosphatase [Dehalococcoidia bacterium]
MVPSKGTKESAGFDLYAAEQVEVPPTKYYSEGRAEIGRALVPIGIRLQLPKGTVGRIASRSGLSIKSNVEVGAGWIDRDYRGEINVELKNFSSEVYTVYPRDRVAQLIVLPLAKVELILVSELNQTVRGWSGFGSTGD